MINLLLIIGPKTTVWYLKINKPLQFRASCTKTSSVRHFGQLDHQHQSELLADCLEDFADQDTISVCTIAKNDNS